MKPVFCVLGLFLSTSVFAQGSLCVNQVLKTYKWDQLAQSQTDCMTKNANFVSAAKVLCNSKLTAPSEMFQRYLTHMTAYNAKLAEMRNETVGSPRFNILAMELRQIETDWLLFGYRRELDEIKWTLLEPAAKSCL